jgi:tRNA (cytidine56-2'-O)-methyltransferase
VIFVLRLGHRIARDKRITTHVALAARALGASGIIMSGDRDNELLNSVNDVAERWGGTFSCEYRRDWKNVIRDYKEREYTTVHLTFYGIPLQQSISEIRGSNLLVIVGGEKVPRDVYDIADYNIAVTNQPHSEVSALAIFLHEYFEGRELYREFDNASIRIIPQERGKRVVNG